MPQTDVIIRLAVRPNIALVRNYIYDWSGNLKNFGFKPDRRISMKMKKLLAAALAATMLFSTMVTSVVASAEETPAIPVDVTIAEIAVGAETYTANFDITFDPAVAGPHLLFDVDATGTLTNIAVENNDLKIYTDEGGTNLSDGMFLVEPKGTDEAISAVNLTATFALGAAAVDGTVIDVDVVVSDSADWDENTLVFAVGSDTYTVEAPVEECDHANADLSTLTLTNVTETQFIYTGICSECSEECEKTVNIGAPLSTAIKMNRSIDPKDDVSLLFKMTGTKITGYTNLALVAIKDVYTETGVDTLTYYYTNPELLSNGQYQFKFSHLSAYEMNNNVHAKMYALNANGEMILLDEQDFSVAFYVSQIAKSHNDVGTALVDMLKFGAMAQIYQEYNTDNLATNVLTEAQLSYATPDANLPDANTNFTKVDYADKYINETTEAGQVQLSKGLAPKSKINLTFSLKKYVGDPYDYYCVFDYYDAYGNKVDESLKIQYAGDIQNQRPAFVFDKTPVSVLDYPVHATVYYGDPDNGGQAVTECDFSIETYISAMISSSNAKLVNLLKAMYAYGHSLAIYAETPAYVAG